MIDIPDNKELFETDKGISEDKIKHVKSINRVEEKDEHAFYENKNHNKKEYTGKNKVENHFEELVNEAHKAHKFLEENKSPYRFCVYKENEEIFIDIIILNDDGTVATEKIKKISKENFQKIVSELYNGKGLFFEKEC